MEELKKNEARVGIADAKIISAPNTIMTIGLGSCVGIALHDGVKKVTALIHIMLPDSTAFKNVTNPYKFADLAIPSILNEMIKMGCNKKYIVAKIAGGASMFKFSEKSINSDIGIRNIEAVREAINKEGIRIKSEDVGGSKGRSMFAEAESGKVFIRIVGQGTKEI
ncbi:MAG: chemotaxis protein CheD [Clostridium sp.]|nr:chemotaxis protein CheD [Clostridium sp.]